MNNLSVGTPAAGARKTVPEAWTGRRARFLILLVVAALALAGCGAESSGIATTEGAQASSDQPEPADDTDQEVAELGLDDTGATGSDSTTDSDATAESGTDSADPDPDQTVGGESDRGDGSAMEAESLGSTLLVKTLDRSGQQSSARFEGRIDLVGAPGSELPGEISLVFAGAYDLANDATEVSVDFGDLIEAAAEADPAEAAEMALFADFFREPLEMITIGDRSWMKWGLLSLFTGTEDMWIEGEADSSTDLTEGFGFGGSGSPTAMLEMLADVDADAEVVGTEEIRGVSTTHYRALVDGQTLAASMSAEERAEFESELGAAPVGGFPIELWLDEDGFLRRYVLDLSEPGALGADSDGELESMVVTFEMWDYGSDLGIAPPPADQIISEDEFDLGFGDLDG